MAEVDLVEIKSNKLLAVEGIDEVNFFDSLFEHWGTNDADVRDLVGKSQYKTKIPTLIKSTGFSKVEYFGIVRDANNNPRAAFESICNILKKNNLIPPKEPNKFYQRKTKKPGLGIYIMPGRNEDGMLEDLCLKLAKENDVLECVDKYIDCVSKKKSLRRVSKRKVQTYLAAMEEIAKDVGTAAKMKYWDFDSSELTVLKKFLVNFR